MSVNGQLAADGITGEDLLIPDVLEVPLSQVGAEAPVPATSQKYLPSTLVPPDAPTVPDPPTGLLLTPYLNSMRVRWTAPVNNGGAKIDKYTVRVASPVGVPATCETVSATMCVVPGLLPATPYTFTVEATNAAGTSAVSTPSAAAQTGVLPPPTWAAGDPLPDPPGQIPIIDLALTTTTAVDILVPGYISIPQGRLRVTNPHGLNVVLDGGALAASMEITDARPAPVPIGFENPVVQRTFRIVTETKGGSPHMVSSAIVQINEGGGWAINSWEVQAA
jgi:hypothetical protein